MTRADLAQEIWRICGVVATALPLLKGETIELVQAQLFGIACAETELLARRQYGYQHDTTGGAFGLWQMERAALESAARWAVQLPACDLAACMLARVHMLAIGEPCGDGPESRAAWWKAYWNTVAGKGTVEEYRERVAGVTREMEAAIETRVG